MHPHDTAIQVIDTVVLGAGHAGLSMSYALQQAGREHIVLEKGRALEQWRSNRWDHFVVNTPAAYTRMLGQTDDLRDSAMGVPLPTYLKTWDAHIDEHRFPIREHAEVSSVSLRDDGRLTVQLKTGNDGPTCYVANNVVSAVGTYQRPNIPACAGQLPTDIHQLRVGTYRNPNAVPEGGILVVGSGQTGVQLADQLADAGREVYLATSKVRGAPRSHRGEDIFYWMDRVGFLNLPVENIPDPAMRFLHAPFVGHDHPISMHSLARKGVTLLGRLRTFDGARALFDDNLREHVDYAQQGYDTIVGIFEGWIASNSTDAAYPAYEPEDAWSPHEPLQAYQAPVSLDLRERGISTVLWATGWRAEFAWAQIPELREELAAHGVPLTCQSAVPGFFWLGHAWIRQQNSANVQGMALDAAWIAQHLR